MDVPRIPIEKRKTSFDEIEVGFTKEQALEEANRCLQCADPLCVKGCPANVSIPEFIKTFREGDVEKAAEIIRLKNFFPSICGRICQHEMQCEGHCILEKTGNPINIGGIERYIGDNASYPQSKKLNGKKAAIIGSGPSGLTVAALLALKGINVTVYEHSNSFGGVIKYGVPEFRLPKKVVSKELSGLHELGIEFEPNSKVAEESIEQLSKEFDVVFVGTGVGRARELKIPGNDLKGISSAMKFLVHINQSGMTVVKEGEKVVVVGAGYVGIDASRSAIRLGADVTCITIAEKEDAIKSVSEKDYNDSGEEGVEFIFGAKVKRFEGKENVEKVVYEKDGKEFSLEADKVVYAIGQAHDKDDKLKNPLRNNGEGCIEVNGNHQTKIENVFAAGDCVHGPKTVIEAIDKGREAADQIMNYLKK